MRNTLRLLVVAALGTVGLAVSADTSGAATHGVVTPGVSFAPTDQMIVKMRPGARAGAAGLSRASGQSVTKVRNLTADTIVVRLPGVQSDAALRATANAMARLPGVEWVEPDVRMTTQTNDPLFEQQWDLGPAGPSVYGVDLEGAWSALPASPASVNVAVVDTGYVAHADLAGVILPGYDFVDDTRIANDGDGRDNDASDPGDWITNKESRRGFFRGCQPSDSSWHGTHVAGTIAAATGNSLGMAGINPHAKIVPVRVLGKCGGYTSDITDGMRWAAGLLVSGAPTNPHVAKVVNLSLGGSGACSSTWQNAINAVTAAGTTIVVAAGNSNLDAAGYSPAGCNGVVTVASTGQAGSRAYYSNYGGTVEIAAPGGDKNADAGDTILSTLNTGTTSPVGSPAGDTYVKYQGTSMASPHVAGVASLMLSTQPALTPDQVSQLLQQTATAFPSGSSCSTTTCGTGILNAAAAVVAAGGSEPPPVDNAPLVTVTTPAEGATVTGITVLVAATATDDIGVAQVEFFIDGESIGVASTSPYSVSWDSTAAPDGAYAVSATATDTIGQTGSDSNTVAVDNAPDPTMHVGDLDASATLGGRGGKWNGTVTITVHDNGESPVAGATVNGSWSNGASGSGSCVTSASGQCSITKSNMKRNSSATFTVTSLTSASFVYAANSSHDPDGDSNGTSIVITKP